MILTDNDYQIMAAQVEEGSNNIEYEKNGETLFLDCTFETDGYFEDDFTCGYGRGTGAWVETSRTLIVDDICCMKDEQSVKIDFDEKKFLEKIA